MNEQAAYLRAMFPSQTEVLDVILHPLTLGHTLLLHRLESPFVTPGAEAGDGDLALALALCSRSFADSVAAVNDSGFAVELQRLIKGRDELELIGARTAFYKYLIVAHEGPKVKKQGSGRESGAPFLLNVKLSLMNGYGYTHTEALNMPLGQALWEHATLLEREGRAEMRNRQDQEHHDRVMAFVAEVRARYEAEQADKSALESSVQAPA